MELAEAAAVVVGKRPAPAQTGSALAGVLVSTAHSGTCNSRHSHIADDYSSMSHMNPYMMIVMAAVVARRLAWARAVTRVNMFEMLGTGH